MTARVEPRLRTRTFKMAAQVTPPPWQRFASNKVSEDGEFASAVTVKHCGLPLVRSAEGSALACTWFGRFCKAKHRKAHERPASRRFFIAGMRVYPWPAS